MYSCKGRGGRGVCEYFDENGSPQKHTDADSGGSVTVNAESGGSATVNAASGGSTTVSPVSRSCGLCSTFGGVHLFDCKGRGKGGRKSCQYFYENGQQKQKQS